MRIIPSLKNMSTYHTNNLFSSISKGGGTKDIATWTCGGAISFMGWKMPSWVAMLQYMARREGLNTLFLTSSKAKAQSLGAKSGNDTLR